MFNLKSVFKNFEHIEDVLFEINQELDYWFDSSKGMCTSYGFKGIKILSESSGRVLATIRYNATPQEIKKELEMALWELSPTRFGVSFDTETLEIKAKDENFYFHFPALYLRESLQKGFSIGGYSYD